MPSLGMKRAPFPMRPSVAGPPMVDMVSAGINRNKDRDRQDKGDVMESNYRCEQAWKPSKFYMQRKGFRADSSKMIVNMNNFGGG